MSDLFSRYRPDTSNLPKFEAPQPPRFDMSGGLTDAQRALIPYIEQVKAEKEQEGRQIQPLKMLLDVLQRGQYVSANVVDEIITSARDDEPLGQDVWDVLEAAWQGVTGERKGSYKDILTERLGWEDRPGKVDWADVVGFTGDVLLDPLTYVGGFGPSSGAKAAAKAYADDAIRLTAREFGERLGTNADELAKFARTSFNRDEFFKLWNESQDAGYRYFVRHGKPSIRRHFAERYKEAYRHGLHTPAEELRDEIAERARNVIPGFEEEAIAKHADELSIFNLTPESGYTDLFGTVQKEADRNDWASRLLEKVEGREGLFGKTVGSTKYQGAGKIAWRFFGKEMNERVGQTWVSRNWDVLRNRLKATKTGGKLSDAWWYVMNETPIGEIKAAFGIRNPYQTALRQTELEAGHQALKVAEYNNVKDVIEAIEGFDDETRDLFVRAMDYSEHVSHSGTFGKGEGYTIFDLLADPEKMAELGIGDGAKIAELATNVRKITQKWFNEYQGWAREGIVKEMDEIVNYLPVSLTNPMRKRGSAYARDLGGATPGIAQSRSATRSALIGHEKAALKWILGLNDAAADTMIRHYHEAEITMDLQEMLLARAYAQAKVAKRVNMIRSMREFGIPFHHVAEPLQSAMAKAGAQLQDMGLTVVEDGALKGYLFDKEVGDILNRAAKMTDPSNFGLLRRAINWYTTWWKGIVTMTTGFHARNFYSNEMVLFQKFGLRSFSPDHQQAALAGVVYALHKTNPKTFLKEIGGDEKWLNRMLAKRYGNFSVEELADEALRRGVIAEAQMGFGSKGLQEKMREALTDRTWKEKLTEKANPFSHKFVGRDVSYRVGAYVENKARFQAFLMDYGEVAARNVDIATLADDAARLAADDDAFKYASMEAKKLLLDYEDLTDFERDVMKNVIPFYTWLRKAIAVQVELALNYPELYAMIPKMMDAFEMENPDVDQNMLPEYMKQLGMFPTHEAEDGTLAFFNPNFPFQEINKIPLMFEEGSLFPALSGEEIRDDIINAVHPFIKGAASMMTEKGYDFFYRRELDAQADSPLLIRYFVSNPKAMEMTDGLLRTIGFEDGLNARLDENGKLQIDARIAHTLENFIPVLRRIEDVILLGQEAGEWFGIGIEDALEAYTNAQDDYEGLRQSFQVLSRWAGVKFYPLDTEDTESRYKADIYHEATGRKREAERYLPGAVRRRAEYRERLDETIRKLGI